MGTGAGYAPVAKLICRSAAAGPRLLMATERQLPGYEHDINNLIDTYAILAHHEQVLSFQAFKQLFRDGCFAYIHQAYWGCEHSPEYSQLLFAVALDRLDIPSPTAPPDSILWQLHQLKPKGAAAANTSVSAAACTSMQHGHANPQHPAAAAAGAAGSTQVAPLAGFDGFDGVTGAAGLAADAMDVDQQQHMQLPQEDQLQPGMEPAAMQVDQHVDQGLPVLQQQANHPVLVQQLQQQQQLQLQEPPLQAPQVAGYTQADTAQALQQQLLPQDVQQLHHQAQAQAQAQQELAQGHLQQQQQHPQQFMLPLQQQQQALLQPQHEALQEVQPQQQQQQQEMQHQPLQQQSPPQQQQQPLQEQPSDDWLLMSSPLLVPQQTPQQTPQQGQRGLLPELSPSDPVWQLMSTPLMSPLQLRDIGATAAAAARPGLEGLDGFMLPSAAIDNAGQMQQKQQQQPLQDQQQQQHAAGGAGLPEQQQMLVQQIPQPGHGEQQGHQVAGMSQQQLGVRQHEQQGHAAGGVQQQQQQQGLPAQPEEEDFLSDLLAILDEAMQGQEQQDAAPAAAAAGEGLGQAAAPAAGTASSQQPPQQMVLQIPLVVKGAALFMLLALHESQLNIPKVPIYVPLPLLQQLATAAAEFKAAGAAAADALQALHVLIQQQRLLVGQFRRPSHWEPQLPPYLMPGGRLPAGLGLNTAIGAAARKAARTAAKSAMQSAAVAAAARAARGAAAFDPGVHREAIFHIKTALRGLSNFKSLQSLCDEYANARKAVFEPLLGSAQAGAAAAGQQQTAQPQQQQQQQGEEEDRDAAGQAGGATGQGNGLVVKRGGSRRKRRAAAAQTAAAGPPSRQQRQPAPAAAEPAQAPAAAAAAGASRAAQGVDLPELFDTGFASSLQGLANSEASRMLLLLDPYYSASKVRKRTADEKRAAKAAEAAAAAEAQGRLDRFKELTMGRAGADSQHDGRAARPPRQQQPSRSAPAAAAGMQDMRQELLAAGVLTEQDLDDGGPSLGPGIDTALSGAAQQVLRRAAQQRQATVQVAEEWLRAQSALIVVDADDDMP